MYLATLDLGQSNKRRIGLRTMKLLTETNVMLLNVCILLLRCTVGIILFGVGSGKVFGWSVWLPLLKRTSRNHQHQRECRGDYHP